ncbi:hypothetical protein BTS2_0076 [Bacillus sp. TS-2]|nr:hypothetical protein BTS2_0076 [Bacillus sp. TS-2]
MNQISTWYIRLGQMALQLFLLNLYWILGTLMGLFIFGLFPATAGLFASLRRILQDEDVRLWKVFWSNYKKEFSKANTLGWITASFFIILLLNIQVLNVLEQNLLHMMLAIFTYILLFFLLIISLFLFPVLVQFNLKTLHYLKYSFYLAVGRPFITILCLSGIAIILYLYWSIPGFIPVFGISLISLVIMKMAFLSFPSQMSKVSTIK